MLPRRSFRRSALVEIFHRVYHIHCNLLHWQLHSLPLGDALAELESYHQILGFRRFDAEAVDRFTIASPDGAVALRAEFHPHRRLRHLGAGRQHPPAGIKAAFGGCYLAPENVPWQQRGTQILYTKRMAGTPVNFLLQPFAFAERHFTVAQPKFAPQDWRPHYGRLEAAVRLMYTLVAEAGDGMVALRNGWGAGATIDWDHVHLLRGGRLPIQDAASSGRAWPLPYERLAGTCDAVARGVVELARGWAAVLGEHATECIAMARENGAMVCYAVPRDRRKERAEGVFSGRVGAYESMGVFVFEEDAEARALREGRVRFEDLENALAQVRPEGI
jgi:hypothetical protein